MSKLLTLKHWQLFLLIIGLPILLEIAVVGVIMTTQQPSNLLFVLPIIIVLVTCIFFGWFYILGTSLYKKLPSEESMNIGFFKFCIYFPVAYIVLISAYIVALTTGYSVGNNSNPGLVLLILPIHLFSMFCIFYCLYFIAKALKTVEVQRTVSFSDFAGEFFMIWFFPIGVWIIQPRVNKLFGVIDNDPYDGILDHNI
jgi:hypothetical protein